MKFGITTGNGEMNTEIRECVRAINHCIWTNSANPQIALGAILGFIPHFCDTLQISQEHFKELLDKAWGIKLNETKF